MVCLGNICRSPLAEGILKSKAKHLKADSAGTAGYHIGKKPDVRSIDIAKKYNIDLTNQRARQFSYQDFKNFDHIFVMDQSNKKNVLRLAKTQEDQNKVHLILEELSTKSTMNVPDPYYDTEQGFKIVYEMLNKACDCIANRI